MAPRAYRAARPGLLVAAAVIGVAAVVVLAFLLRAGPADIRRIVEEMQREATASETDSKILPRVTRWDVVIRLPKAGLPDAYQWVVRAGRSESLDAGRDRLFGFTGETPDPDSPMRIESSVVDFNKERRWLSSYADVRMTLSWGTINARGMVFAMREECCRFLDDVRVVIEKAKAPVSSDATRPSPPRSGQPAVLPVATAPPADASAEAQPTEDQPPKAAGAGQLVIESETLEVLGKEDRAVFRKDVVARDDNGTIWADEMEVLYYSKEERAADATLPNIKKIICTGNVRIDQGTQAAKCHTAVFDGKSNTIAMDKSKDGEQVDYWNGKDQYQVKADHLFIDRTTNKVQFSGNTKTVDFSSQKKDFFGLGTEETEPETTPPDEKGKSGASEKPAQKSGDER